MAPVTLFLSPVVIIPHVFFNPTRPWAWWGFFWQTMNHQKELFLLEPLGLPLEDPNSQLFSFDLLRPITWCVKQWHWAPHSFFPHREVMTHASSSLSNSLIILYNRHIPNQYLVFSHNDTKIQTNSWWRTNEPHFKIIKILLFYPSWCQRCQLLVHNDELHPMHPLNSCCMLDRSRPSPPFPSKQNSRACSSTLLPPLFWPPLFAAWNYRSCAPFDHL